MRTQRSLPSIGRNENRARPIHIYGQIRPPLLPHQTYRRLTRKFNAPTETHTSAMLSVNRLARPRWISVCNTSSEVPTSFLYQALVRRTQECNIRVSPHLRRIRRDGIYSLTHHPEHLIIPSDLRSSSQPDGSCSSNVTIMEVVRSLARKLHKCVDHSSSTYVGSWRGRR